MKMPIDYVSTENPHILDSGDRTQFESGAVRDMRAGKGRCDLMPLDVVAYFLRDDDEKPDYVLDAVYRFQESDDISVLDSAIDHFNGEKWIVSMYSTTCDISGICKKYGGGGHSKAAGFQCTVLPFKKGE